MNSIERLGVLSQEMITAKPPRTALTVFFLVVSIEAIYSLAEVGPSTKVQILIEFFEKYVLPDDQKILLARIIHEFL